MRTRDEQVFSPRESKSAAETPVSAEIAVGEPERKAGGRMGDMDRLCATYADGMRDLFQQKSRGRKIWDPVKARERARTIRLLRVPGIEDEKKAPSESGSTAGQEDPLVSTATAASHNTSPCAAREPRKADQWQDNADGSHVPGEADKHNPGEPNPHSHGTAAAKASYK